MLVRDRDHNPVMQRRVMRDILLLLPLFTHCLISDVTQHIFTAMKKTMPATHPQLHIISAKAEDMNTCTTKFWYSFYYVMLMQAQAKT